MNTPDPYNGNTPRMLWDKTLSGNVQGLRPTSRDGEPIDNWMSCEIVLDRRGIGRRIKGKTVIELGCGKVTDFRDYCVRNGATKYTGVDLFMWPSEKEVIDGTEVSRIQEDVLRFLMKQPDESAIIAGFVFFCDELLDVNSMRKVGISPKEIIRLIAFHVVRVIQKGESLIIFPGVQEYDELFRPMGVTRQEFGMIYNKSA